MKANIAVIVAALLVLLAVLLLIYNDTNAFVTPIVRTSAVLPTPTNIALTDQLVDPTGKAIPCFYINLDRSTDRRERFTQRAKVHNLECTRIPGVDGKDPEAVKIITRNDFAKTMSPSEVGCTASHLKTIRKAFELNLDYALVLEDDTTFDFVSYWPKDVIPNLLKDIPSYVGFVQLFWTINRKDYATFVVPTHVAQGEDSRMTSAYIVTRRGMKDVLKHALNKDGTFKIVKTFSHQREGVADKYIYDLSRLCTCGLPLLSVDIWELPSTIQTKPLMNTKHPSFTEVTKAKRVYATKQVVYKSYWPGRVYRLGDAIKGYPDARYHTQMFPNSIAAKYFEKTKHYNKFDVLAQVVTDFRMLHECAIPHPNDIVLHLRVGDVLELSPYSVVQHLEKSMPYINDVHYIKPFSYFEDEFAKFDQGSKVIIMTGTHTGYLGMVKSDDYTIKIKAFLADKGFDVSLRTGFGPDEDFVFASFSKHLVTTGGGFSYLIQQVQALLL